MDVINYNDAARHRDARCSRPQQSRLTSQKRVFFQIKNQEMRMITYCPILNDDKSSTSSLMNPDAFSKHYISEKKH